MTEAGSRTASELPHFEICMAPPLIYRSWKYIHFDAQPSIHQSLEQGVPRVLVGLDIEIAADVAKREARRRESATVAEAWAAYLAERKPHWSARHHADHEKLAQTGGAKRKRGAGLIVAGPLAELMPLRLDELDADRLKAWAARESVQRPARVRLALRLLTVFLGWCATRPAFAVAAHPKAASGRDVREVVGKPARKDDALQREQLPAWFDAVGRIDNPVISAYLQALLLTGARREELAGLRWEDVDFRWRSLAMRDKVEGGRMVPLTPYVAHLLAALPRRLTRDGRPNPWVFSSVTSESGRLVEPRIAHGRACMVAGLDGLTLHGLRRSFGTLSEWVEAPVGVVAQIQGHKPSAIAEKHYRVRPLDLLRMWHEKIEAWILEQAGVSFDARAAPAGRLHRVAVT